MTLPQELPVLLSALLLGVVGSGHCIGMCGGIAGALGHATPPTARLSPVVSSLFYSSGRVLSYGTFGAIAGFVGESAYSMLGTGLALRVFAGSMIVLFGLHTAGWGFGLAWIESFGLRFWRRLTPLVSRIGRPDRRWKILMLGALWGFLPCGLVYSALAASALAGGPVEGAMFMVAFGLGTMPALVAATGVSERLGSLMRGRGARRAAGIVLVLFGGWTIYAAVASGHGDHHHHPAHTEAASTPSSDRAS